MLVCFDLDGTIIDDIEYIWYTLHKHLGVDMKEVYHWHEMFRRGKVTYDEWFAQDIRWWKSAKKKDFLDAVSTLKLMPGACETIEQLKKEHTLAIVSGSLGFVIEHFFPEQPFDYVFVNEILFDEQGDISGYKVTPYDFEHKATGLKDIAQKENIPLEQTVFVGDHENDIEAVKIAGLGVSFNSKSRHLDTVADYVIKKKDLREILPLINPVK